MSHSSSNIARPFLIHLTTEFLFTIPTVSSVFLLTEYVCVDMAQTTHFQCAYHYIEFYMWQREHLQ